VPASLVIARTAYIGQRVVVVIGSPNSRQRREKARVKCSSQVGAADAVRLPLYVGSVEALMVKVSGIGAVGRSIIGSVVGWGVFILLISAYSRFTS
jgi:hypothetical protein